MNQNELSILVADCLKKGKRIHQGKIVGASNAGGKVQIKMPVSVPGFGTVVSAIALNDCIGGNATAFLDNDGKWLALSSNSASLASGTQITNFRRRRSQVTAITSPFKTLFIELDPNSGKTVLYVGGDRATAALVGEV